MILQLIIMACIGLVLPTLHLKIGTLNVPIGLVTLIENDLMVKYRLTTLPPKLDVFLIQLDDIVQENDKKLER